MIDEAKLLLDRLEALTREAVELADSPLNAEKDNQMRGIHQAVAALKRVGAGVPKQLLEQKESLEGALSDGQKAQNTVELLRDRLAEVRALLPSPRKTAKTREDHIPGSERAQKGVVLPRSEYQIAVRQVLRQMGGQGKKREVIDRVYEILGPRLGPADRGPAGQTSDQPKWMNRTAWARQDLVDQGLIRIGSPVGIWQLTEAGMRED